MVKISVCLTGLAKCLCTFSNELSNKFLNPGKCKKWGISAFNQITELCLRMRALITHKWISFG